MARKRVSRKKREGNRRVGDKIRVLEREGEKPDQAIATAMSMERAGRLRKGGRYVHKRKGRRSSR